MWEQLQLQVHGATPGDIGISAAMLRKTRAYETSSDEEEARAHQSSKVIRKENLLTLSRPRATFVVAEEPAPVRGSVKRAGGSVRRGDWAIRQHERLVELAASTCQFNKQVKLAECDCDSI